MAIDDFCQKFEPVWQKRLLRVGARTRARIRRLWLSEIMTILVAFHQYHYRNFKHFYLEMVVRYWRDAFAGLVSYSGFVEWIPTTLIPMCVYLKHCCGSCTGIALIDSTTIKVCHNRRIKQHQVFNGLAARGKTSVDWFFGFKIHIVVNQFGEIVNVQLTPGNTDDRKPVPD